MSRAFVKEQDGPEIAARPAPELPAGARNHVTPAGARRIREQLADLRADAASLRAQSDGLAASRAAQLAAEIRYWEARIATFVETPTPSDPTRAGFGTRITIAGDRGERTVTIVGVDEVDADQGRISWVSPLARALIGAEEGDEVTVATPNGPTRFEVLAIERAN